MLNILSLFYLFFITDEHMYMHVAVIYSRIIQKYKSWMYFVLIKTSYYHHQIIKTLKVCVTFSKIQKIKA